MLISSAAKALLGAGAMAMLLGAQNGKKVADAKTLVFPITQEEHHHLVLENEYVRVFHVEVAPHSETLYHQHDMDYVFVTLGDSKVASERADGKSTTLELKDGETRFTKGGFAHKAVNLSDKPFVNVTVELKKPAELSNGGVGGGCWGLGCDVEILKANTFKCSRIYTAGSGTGVGLPDSANRLVVMMTDGRDEDTGKVLSVGDVLWKAAGVRLGIKGDRPGAINAAELYPLRAVVCQFAKHDEDFAKH
jgi:quercetin dioxygenase-like cupin family protein